MAHNIIEIEGLTKAYRAGRGRRTVVLDELDLAVPGAGVYGFLGPNGSGKTTTIRCLLGLVRPTRGALRLLDRPIPSGLHDAIRSVGAIVESPALFPTITGRENLRLLGAIDGIGPRRVDEVLGVVGLDERAGDLVQKYSLGMRQRLAVAGALLGDPDVLVLDEPANGLDPGGMAWLRGLLRERAATGRTVVLSSHVLSEVAQTVDDVVVLHRGVLRYAGPLDALAGGDSLEAAFLRLTEAVPA